MCSCVEVVLAVWIALDLFKLGKLGVFLLPCRTRENNMHA